MVLDSMWAFVARRLGVARCRCAAASLSFSQPRRPLGGPSDMPFEKQGRKEKIKGKHKSSLLAAERGGKTAAVERVSRSAFADRMAWRPPRPPRRHCQRHAALTPP